MLLNIKRKILEDYDRTDLNPSSREADRFTEHRNKTIAKKKKMWGTFFEIMNIIRETKASFGVTGESCIVRNPQLLHPLMSCRFVNPVIYNSARLFAKRFQHYTKQL